MTVNDAAMNQVNVRLKNLGVDVDKLMDCDLDVEELSNLADSLEELTKQYRTLKDRLSAIEN